jgi:hypothetical protein
VKVILFLIALGGGYGILTAIGLSPLAASLGAWGIAIVAAFAYHLIRTRIEYGDYEYRPPDDRGF